MVIFSLNETYSITYKLFSELLGNVSLEDYSVGLKLNSPGFLIHLTLFSLLIALPVVVKL